MGSAWASFSASACHLASSRHVSPVPSAKKHLQEVAFGVREVALALGVGRALARALLVSGELPVHVVAHQTVVLRADLLAWLAAAYAPSTEQGP